MKEEKISEFQEPNLSEEEIQQINKLIKSITQCFQEIRKSITNINQSLSQMNERTKETVEYCRQMLGKSKERKKT